jgi:site-specific DNA recombinase
MALYARVSTQEQTKGNYPSCESQIEELEAFCKAKDWQVQALIKDEGISAGSLKREGMARLRWLVETEQIDGILCTWYDRLTRSRDFYILDQEFKNHNVAFITLHDPTDRHTASGRFLETMLVAAKTYEREQTGEKVRTKMRMRAEKGMWNGGLVPFGFVRDPQNHVLSADESKQGVLRQLFQIYVDTHSDFAVRNWLKAHNIPAPQGKAEWTSGSIRDLLSNRRYIGEIEINRGNKGVEGLSESDAYSVVPAPHGPLVPRELFELAQSIRHNRSAQFPHSGSKGGAHKGQGQNFSRNQCQRVYLLQGNMICGLCGAAMSPHYVYHKPNEKEKRRTPSFIYHYTCAEKMKYRQAVNHSNRVLARVAENWMLEAINGMATSESFIPRALEMAWQKTEGHLQPVKDALSQCRLSLEENQRRIDELVATATNTRSALLDLLTEKAHELKIERERLKVEQHRLQEMLSPLNTAFDEKEFRSVFSDFALMREKAEPEELQRLLRLMVRRLEWMPNGEHRAYYYLQGSKTGRGKQPPGGKDGGLPQWFETSVASPGRAYISLKPVFLFSPAGEAEKLDVLLPLRFPFHPPHHQPEQPL